MSDEINPATTAQTNDQLAPVPDRDDSVTVRPFWWSVWREIWENKSLYIAPLIVMIVQLFGFLISTIGMADRRRAVLLLDPATQTARISQPYDAIAMIMIFTAFVIAVFYCLDALYGERRDRSILFWKSLPISDSTAVFSKFVVPLVVVPVITLVIIVATQLLMMLWSTVVLLPGGMAETTWIRYPIFQQSLILIYGSIVIALWHAPIYGWLLLVSGWVRRAAFLWALMPLIVIVVFEKITFNTTHFGAMLWNRLTGFASAAFDFRAHFTSATTSLTQLTPGHFFATPDLWIGLAFAAAFVFAAIRLRRYAGPI